MVIEPSYTWISKIIRNIEQLDKHLKKKSLSVFDDITHTIDTVTYKKHSFSKEKILLKLF